MRIYFFILLVGLLTFWQSWGFSIFNIKPNLALVSVIAASFFIANFWQGFLLVSLAAFILKFSPGFAKEILVFSLIGFGAVLIKNRFPWHHSIGNLILIAAGTVIFYLFFAPSLIVSFVFLKEFALNLIFGAAIFALLKYLWQTK